MIAQTFHNDIVDGGSDASINDGEVDSQPDAEGSISDEPVTEAIDEADPINPQQPGNPDQLQQEVDQTQEEQSSPMDTSLVRFVFEFLSGLGYPPRRLHEFKEEFVHEEGGKGKPTLYTITIPDRLYGKESQIPNEKLKELVNGIEQKFGYSYQNYKRSGLQIVFLFSSVDEAAQQAAQMQPTGDVLDQVYGTPKGKSKGNGSQMKGAETIHEMIKVSKSGIAEQLLKIIGG
ncbi:MAG: hypothetical protein HC888_01685 [Candidatus Competibacteraceae bacterium]|nr:hypothetical protein [Candidatus Competibacteraceae bacterium]